MSNEEHYFENLLFAYARDGYGGYDQCKKDDSNIKYLSDDAKRAIETCVSYVVDCCGWKEEWLKAFLDGDWKVSD